MWLSVCRVKYDYKYAVVVMRQFNVGGVGTLLTVTPNARLPFNLTTSPQPRQSVCTNRLVLPPIRRLPDHGCPFTFTLFVYPGTIHLPLFFTHRVVTLGPRPCPNHNCTFNDYAGTALKFLKRVQPNLEELCNRCELFNHSTDR